MLNKNTKFLKHKNIKFLKNTLVIPKVNGTSPEEHMYDVDITSTPNYSFADSPFFMWSYTDTGMEIPF